MRRATIFAILAIASLGGVSVAESPEFEFKSGESCSSHEPDRDEKLTLKRGRDGTLRARVTYISSCADPQYAPRVEYLDGLVRLRVERNWNVITLHCACTNKLTFKLIRKVPRGTAIVFGFGSDEPRWRAVAP
jgi:hypothetical protein